MLTVAYLYVRPVLLFGLLLCFTSSAFSQHRAHYRVFYDSLAGTQGLLVQVDYTHSKAADSSVFYYENTFWGETNRFNSLVIPEQANPAVSVVAFPDENEIVVRHPHRKKVSFTYRIKQDFEDPAYQTFFRPVVKDRFFHIPGQALFVAPLSFTQLPSGKKIAVTIEWIGFPEHFTLHNTFGSGQKKQKLHLLFWEEFYHSFFVGGDYRVHRFSYKGKPVYFAIRGEWYNGLSDEALFEDLQLAVRSQRDFWNDYTQPYFTVIMSPTVSQADSAYRGQSSNGTAVKNGFVIQSTNNPFNNREVYRYMFHHELMHNWIGIEIVNRYEELNYWFSEGFTEYYTYKNRLRIGEISLEEWREAFNREVIEAHWKNPERNIPNYKVKDGFWKSRQVSKVPYRRGALFAFWLDNQLLLHSDYTFSLDDLMRKLLRHCQRTKAKFSDELLLEMAHTHLDRDIAYFFQKHVLQGEDLDLSTEKWVEGFEFHTTDSIPALIFTQPEPRYLLR